MRLKPGAGPAGMLAALGMLLTVGVLPADAAGLQFPVAETAPGTAPPETAPLPR